MTTLKLREGYEVETDLTGYVYYKRIGANRLFVYVCEGPFAIRAYPYGEFRVYSPRLCETIEEAHAYLIAVGSDSPWKEV